MRKDNRQPSQVRDIKIEKDYTMHAEGSVLYCQGNTKVLCNATVEDRVPPHVLGTGKGWVTAEYSMLPRATVTRNQRDVSKLKLSPRSTEIQRLIGRALRGAVDMEKLGERSIIIDCDVIQADGGTRCASITGGFIALALAIDKLIKNGELTENPITKQVAALSVGIVGDEAVCDLCYEEDCRAETDMNVIMTSNGGFIEIQGTAEGKELTKSELQTLLSLAEEGMKQLFEKQNEVING
ncbi:MAG: ribonuclease PH [Clostridia bacterium]|nr:ribonuclease PH [Clostridia bacterium]